MRVGWLVAALPHWVVRKVGWLVHSHSHSSNTILGRAKISVGSVTGAAVAAALALVCGGVHDDDMHSDENLCNATKEAVHAFDDF